MRDTERPFLTPPEVSERYRVNPAKVIAWIKRGELRAVNVASRATGRPRYVISEADLVAFENRRAATPVKPVPRRRKSAVAAGVIEFY